MVIPGHPYRGLWSDIGRKYRQRFHLGSKEDDPQPQTPTCRVQVVRSVSDWSHGFLTEHSIQDACEWCM